MGADEIRERDNQVKVTLMAGEVKRTKGMSEKDEERSYFGKQIISRGHRVSWTS